MSATTTISQIEAELVKLWERRSATQKASELETARALEAERRREAAMAALPALRKKEAAAWVAYEKELDALAAAVDKIDAIRGEIRAAYGSPEATVHRAMKAALTGELDRRRMRERMASGRNREIADKAHAAELREFAKAQKAAARKVRGDDKQIDDRLEATERAIHRLEGKAPPVHQGPAQPAPMTGEDLIRFDRIKKSTPSVED